MYLTISEKCQMSEIKVSDVRNKSVRCQKYKCQMSEISPLSLPRPLAELGAIESSSKLVCEEFAC